MKSYIKRNLSNSPKLNINEILVVIAMIISFYQVKIYFDFNIYVKYLIGITVIISILLPRKFLINKNLRYPLISLWAPYVIALVYSTIIFLAKNDVTFSMYKHGVALVIYITIAIFSAVAIVVKFKRKAIDFVFAALVINYAYVFICFLYQYGINGLLHFRELNENRICMMLESSEIIYCTGLFLIYYFFIENKNEHLHKLKIALCCIILFYGTKKIVIGGLILIIAVNYILKITKRIPLVMYIVGIIMVIASFIYIYKINTGLISDIVLKYNLEMTTRIDFAQYFQPYYDFSILYTGKGIGFVDRIMEMYEIWRFKSNVGVSLHNDLLRLFIEYGFIGSLVYLMNLIIFQAQRFRKKYNFKISKAYFYLAMYTVVLYFTDNVANYYHYILVCSLIIFCLIYSNDIDEGVKT